MLVENTRVALRAVAALLILNAVAGGGCGRPKDYRVEGTWGGGGGGGEGLMGRMPSLVAVSAKTVRDSPKVGGGALIASICMSGAVNPRKGRTVSAEAASQVRASGRLLSRSANLLPVSAALHERKGAVIGVKWPL